MEQKGRGIKPSLFEKMQYEYEDEDDENDVLLDEISSDEGFQSYCLGEDLKFNPSRDMDGLELGFMVAIDTGDWSDAIEYAESLERKLTLEEIEELGKNLPDRGDIDEYIEFCSHFMRPPVQKDLFWILINVMEKKLNDHRSLVSSGHVLSYLMQEFPGMLFGRSFIEMASKILIDRGSFTQEGLNRISNLSDLEIHSSVLICI